MESVVDIRQLLHTYSYDIRQSKIYLNVHIGKILQNVSDLACCHTLRFKVHNVRYLFIYTPEEAKMAKR